MLKTEKHFSWHSFLDRFTPLLALAVIFSFFSLAAPDQFTTPQNLTTIANHAAIIAILTLALTFILIAGKMDLSLGAIFSLAAAAPFFLLKFHTQHFPPQTIVPLTILAILLLCSIAGLINGLLVTRIKAPAFAITLATAMIFLTAANQFPAPAEPGIPFLKNIWTWPATPHWPFVPPAVWTAIILIASSAALLKFTRLGRHICATGSSEETANYCAVQINRIRIFVFSLAALLTAVAAILSLSNPAAAPHNPQNLTILPLAAALFAGTSLKGGKGSITSTIITACAISALLNGLEIINLQPWLVRTIPAFILLPALAFDHIRNPRNDH